VGNELGSEVAGAVVCDGTVVTGTFPPGIQLGDTRVVTVGLPDAAVNESRDRVMTAPFSTNLNPISCVAAKSTWQSVCEMV
jgi:hypothetical protein